MPPTSRSTLPTTETYGGTPYVLAKDDHHGWMAKIEVPKLSCVCYGPTKKAVRDSARRTIDWILLEKL